MDIALNSQMKQVYTYYIDLLSATINNEELPNPIDNINWEFIVRHAQRNSVLNILGYAVGKLENKPPESIVKVIENERRFSILKETSQLVEVEKVLDAFEKSSIKNLPLKGYFMKHLYNQTDLRTMTDVDILVNKKDFKKITKVFQELGYTKCSILNSNEIHFKKDLLYFEIQCDLNENDDSFYDDIWDNVNLREGYKYSYSMSPEDFYVYMVYHCSKHFSSGGIGIRMLMDIYVFLSKYPKLNFNYVNSCFEKLKITTFAERLKKLSENWFSNDKTVIDNFGEFILYCSTYGLRDVYFYQDSSRNKKNYWLKQVFIPYSKMKNTYSYLSKAPFLLPISWIQYWFTRLFISRDIQLKKGFSDRAENLSDQNAQFVDKLMSELEII